MYLLAAIASVTYNSTILIYGLTIISFWEVNPWVYFRHNDPEVSLFLVAL